jgi:uncharacterized protein (DUF849 family)
MNPRVIITCAVTGAGDTSSKSPHVPVTPAQIADAARSAADAGAAVVHVHVRNPETGTASRDPRLFHEVVERIRDINDRVIINVTGGMGGDLLFGAPEPLPLASGTDFVGAAERVGHLLEIVPDIGSLDIGSTNFDEVLYGTTPNISRFMAHAMRDRGVRPEIEVFELGHIELAKQLLSEGLFDAAPLFQLCLGVRYGAPATADAMKAMRDALPSGAKWSAFGIGRMQMPMVAQAVIMGGHVRVGLEDNLYLDRGVLATNAQLVERAAKIIELLGSKVLSPAEARQELSLRDDNRAIIPQRPAIKP